MMTLMLSVLDEVVDGMSISLAGVSVLISTLAHSTINT
jgi:hypothetical protein